MRRKIWQALLNWFAALERRKDLIAGLQAVATVFALIIGAAWTYALTKQFRETVPRLSIKQTVSSWRLHDGSTLLRVDSTVTNTGKVLIDRLTGKIFVLRLFPETKEQAANYSKGGLLFSCKDDHGKVLANCVSEQGLNLPASSKHVFEISDLKRTLEPGETESYWRYVQLDGAVRTVELMTFIQNPKVPTGRGWVLDDTHEISTSTQ